MTCLDECAHACTHTYTCEPKRSFIEQRSVIVCVCVCCVCVCVCCVCVCVCRQVRSGLSQRTCFSAVKCARELRVKVII